MTSQFIPGGAGQASAEERTALSLSARRCARGGGGGGGVTLRAGLPLLPADDDSVHVAPVTPRSPDHTDNSLITWSEFALHQNPAHVKETPILGAGPTGSHRSLHRKVPGARGGGQRSPGTSIGERKLPAPCIMHDSSAGDHTIITKVTVHACSGVGGGGKNRWLSQGFTTQTPSTSLYT